MNDARSAVAHYPPATVASQAGARVEQPQQAQPDVHLQNVRAHLAKFRVNIDNAVLSYKLQLNDKERKVRRQRPPALADTDPDSKSQPPPP